MTSDETPTAEPNSSVQLDDIPAEIIDARPDGITPKQALLAELVVLEGMSKGKAAIAAGYKLPQAGYHAWRSKAVTEYVQDLIREHLLESSVAAVHKLKSLMANAKSEYVQLEGVLEHFPQPDAGSGWVQAC